MVDLASVKTELFTLKTKAIGNLSIQFLSIGKLKKLLKKFKSLREANSNEFILSLISIVALKLTDDAPPEELSEDDVLKLTVEEINEFAEKFIQSDPTFKRTEEHIELEETEKDEFGANILEFNKQGEESWSEYLQRLLILRLDKSLMKIANMTKNFPIGIKESILKSFDLSKQLGNSLAAFTSHEVNLGTPKKSYHSRGIPEELEGQRFPIIRSPILDTNERIDKIIDFQDNLKPVISDSLKLLREMNTLGIEYAGDFKIEAKKSHRLNKLILGIGVLTLLATLIISSISLYKSFNAERAANEYSVKYLDKLEVIDKNMNNYAREIANSIKENMNKQNELILELKNNNNESIKPNGREIKNKKR